MFNFNNSSDSNNNASSSSSSNEQLRVRLMRELEVIVAARLVIENDPAIKELKALEKQHIKPLRDAVRAAGKIIDDKKERIIQQTILLQKRYEQTQDILDEKAWKREQHRLLQLYKETDEYKQAKEVIKKRKEPLKIIMAEFREMIEEEDLAEKLEELDYLKRIEEIKSAQIKLENELDERSLGFQESFARLVDMESLIKSQYNTNQTGANVTIEKIFAPLREHSDANHREKVMNYGSKYKEGTKLNILTKKIAELPALLKARHQHYDGKNYSDYQFKAVESQLTADIEALQAWHQFHDNFCVQSYSVYTEAYHEVISKLLSVGKGALLISAYSARADNIKSDLSTTVHSVKNNEKLWDPIDENTQDGVGKTAKEWIAAGATIKARK